MEEGIEWSAPVVVETAGEGTLKVALPAQVIERLEIAQGDVLSFTAFAGGGIEVWSIKKSPYASLDDAAPEAAAEQDNDH